MTRAPRILFDPAKDAANIRKHGLSLSRAAEIIAAATATFLDDRYGYGEDRFVSFGPVDGRLCVAVWTDRDGAISVRRANKKEQEMYG